MAAVWAVVCAVLLATVSADPAQPQTAPAGGLLRWARGVVVSASPESVVLKLRDRELTLVRDLSLEIMPAGALASGRIVDAHYADRRGTRRAVIVLGSEVTDSGATSKRPGNSVLGTLERPKKSSLTMRVAGKRRGFSLTKKTRLIDQDGRLIGEGQGGAERLAPDELLLVKYEGDEDGDRALEIRTIRR